MDASLATEIAIYKLQNVLKYISNSWLKNDQKLDILMDEVKEVILRLQVYHNKLDQHIKQCHKVTVLADNKLSTGRLKLNLESSKKTCPILMSFKDNSYFAVQPEIFLHSFIDNIHILSTDTNENTFVSHINTSSDDPMLPTVT